MHPGEQPYQETSTSQAYGMYMGAEERPVASTPSHYSEQGYSGEWQGGERIGGGGAQAQQQQRQQMYGYMPFPTAVHILPEGRTFAIFSYALGWFSGLVILFFNWQNRFVRFHALQATFFFGVVSILDILLLGMMFPPFWHHRPIGILLAMGMFLLVNTIAVIAWVVGMVQAGMGNYYELPFIGGLIKRKITPRTPPVK